MLSQLGLLESIDPFKLVVENDKCGNIEYKLRLDNKTELGLKKLATQFKWRINQSFHLYKTYEAYYVLGIMDNGSLPHKKHNITDTIIKHSIDTLNYVINQLKYEVIGEEYYCDNLVCILKIRPIFALHNEINIVLTGLTGSGKTSLMSRIVNNELDDGDGFSRHSILKHEHEKETGNTSYITRKFIGFNKNKLINEESCDEGIEYIYSESDRYIGIDDLPGCVKYIKTTLFGLLSSINDITVICISVDDVYLYDIIEEKKQYYINIYKICCCRKNNVVFLLTKMDLIAKENQELYVFKLSENIKKMCNIPIINIVNNSENIDMNIDMDMNIDIDIKHPYLIKFTTLEYEGAIDFINYLCNISKIQLKRPKLHHSILQLFITNEIFISSSIDQTVLYGYCSGQTIKKGDILYGYSNGKITKITISNIKKKNIECNTICANETGSIIVKPNILKYKDSLLFTLTSLDYLEKYFVNKAIFTPLYSSDKDNIIEKEYILFICSTIQHVFITKNDDKHILNCKNDKHIFIGHNNLCVIKNDNNDIIIGFISQYIS
jgi:GTPase